MQRSGKTEDGIDVYLDSYYVHGTYAGCIDGIPTTDQSIDHARRYLTRLWGPGRSILVVKPTEFRPPIANASAPMMIPDRCMMVWLNSYAKPASEPDMDGSHLFVIWFDEQDAQDPMLAALKHVNEAGGWWANAKGWGF